MSKGMWEWLGRRVIASLTKTGSSVLINDLRNRFESGAVDAEFLEGIARTLEEMAKAIRQIYGAGADRFMDSVRQKARVEVREVEGGDDEREKED